MKLISSVIRPARLDAVKDALHDRNVVALTISEVRDYAPQERPTIAWMGRLQTQEFNIKFEVRVVVEDDDADDVVESGGARGVDAEFGRWLRLRDADRAPVQRLLGPA